MWYHGFYHISLLVLVIRNGISSLKCSIEI